VALAACDYRGGLHTLGDSQLAPLAGDASEHVIAYLDVLCGDMVGRPEPECAHGKRLAGRTLSTNQSGVVQPGTVSALILSNI
jgi:hypothetical protein